MGNNEKPKKAKPSDLLDTVALDEMPAAIPPEMARNIAGLEVALDRLANAVEALEQLDDGIKSLLAEMEAILDN